MQVDHASQLDTERLQEKIEQLQAELDALRRDYEHALAAISNITKDALG